MNKETVYTVELKDEYAKKMGKSVIRSCKPPEKIQITKRKVKFGIVDYSDFPPDKKMNSWKSRRYINKHWINLDSTQVKMITSVSDADNTLFKYKLGEAKAKETLKLFISGAVSSALP